MSLQGRVEALHVASQACCDQDSSAGRGVSDGELQHAVLQQLQDFAAGTRSQRPLLAAGGIRSRGSASAAVALVETAGGPASPGPSGSLQVSCGCSCRARWLRPSSYLLSPARLLGFYIILAANFLKHKEGGKLHAPGPRVKQCWPMLAMCTQRTHGPWLHKSWLGAVRCMAASADASNPGGRQPPRWNFGHHHCSGDTKCTGLHSRSHPLCGQRVQLASSQPASGQPPQLRGCTNVRPLLVMPAWWG